MKPWETITTYFSAEGAKELRETVYDNFDFTAIHYENGISSLRLDVDGDVSEPWLLRETIYGSVGGLEQVNTYARLEDIPLWYEYLFLG